MFELTVKTNYDRNVNLPKLFQEWQYKANERIAEFMVAEARKNAYPSRTFGELDRGIKYKNLTKDGFEFVSDMPYSIYVEMGTRAHWPPIKPLLRWAKKKFGKSKEWLAYPIQKGIAAHGTEAHPFMMPAVMAASPFITISYKEEMRNVVERGMKK